MKLKITHTQLECLGRLIGATLKMFTPDDNVDRLLYVHMDEFHKKLGKRFIERRQRYTIDLPATTAIAFYEFWRDINIADVYGRNTIQRILNDIDSNNLVKSI